jgi:DNA invertase Pin-like site-specific DNA recombinase
MKVAVYARISTFDKGQNLDTQLLPLREYVARRWWSIYKEYTDTISGAKEKRPWLDKLMNEAHKRKFDCIVVFRFDRMGRSTKHLLWLLDTFTHLGIDFVSYNENIDSSTPSGKLMFTMITAFAEFERSIIAERVRAWLARAKAQWQKLGRPEVRLSYTKKSEIHELRDKWISIRKIAKQLNIKKNQVEKLLSDKPS